MVNISRPQALIAWTLDLNNGLCFRCAHLSFAPMDVMIVRLETDLQVGCPFFVQIHIQTSGVSIVP